MTHREPDEYSDDAEFGTTIARVRSVAGEVAAEDRELIEPPVDLWASISTAMAAERTASADDEGLVAPVIAMPRRGGRGWLAAAAALIVVAGVGVTLVATRDDGPKEIAAPEVLKRTELRVLADGRPIGQAELVRQSGELHLRVTATDMPSAPNGDYYEVWLMNAEGPLVPHSVGPMEATGAATAVDVVVPDDVDPSEFPVVDISIEHRDGDAAHSGNSQVRGTLS